MPKTKQRSQKSTDTFTTFSGKTMNRRQLSQKIYRANRAIKKSIKYLTGKEYKVMKEQYENLAELSMGKGNYYLSIKNVHDVKKLKRIEQAATRLLSYTYLNENKYNKMISAQKKTLSTTLSTTVYVKDKEGKVIDQYTKYLLSDAQMDRLRDYIFSSDEWHHLVENELFDSKQAIEIINKKGSLNNFYNAAIVKYALLSMEEEMSENPNLTFYNVLDKKLKEINNLTPSELLELTKHYEEVMEVRSKKNG